MFEQFLKTNEGAGVLCSVEDLLEVVLVNDHLSRVIHNWQSVIAGMFRVPEEVTWRDMLLPPRQRRKAKAKVADEVES